MQWQCCRGGPSLVSSAAAIVGVSRTGKSTAMCAQDILMWCRSMRRIPLYESCAEKQGRAMRVKEGSHVVLW